MNRCLLALAGALVVAAGCSARPDSSRSAALSPSELTLFDDVTPPNLAAADGAAVELGIKFRAAQAGLIDGIRFYRGDRSTGTTYAAHLFAADGTLLGQTSITLGSEATPIPAWYTAPFDTPVAIAANTDYVAGYFTPIGAYAYEYGGLADGVVNGPLSAAASTPLCGNGLFAYGPGGTLPTNSARATNYFVDVIYSTAPSDVPPTHTTP